MCPKPERSTARGERLQQTASAGDTDTAEPLGAHPDGTRSGFESALFGRQKDSDTARSVTV